MSKEIKDLLLKDISYAKNSCSRELLYQVHGELIMAATLKGITTEEFLDMDSLVVRDGINNPAFIKEWNKQYWHKGPEIAYGLTKMENDVLEKYRNSITRRAFQEFVKSVRILIGIHVPAMIHEEEVNHDQT